ncbi:condensation domain-containing protein [Streptomyces sp. NBC_01007]|nr:condensation domain-containing protein [Streptomyces sp. NBC_01007]WRZ95696.1 condensation domain-containing protein [Streptomyces sp. NBC_01007]
MTEEPDDTAPLYAVLDPGRPADPASPPTLDLHGPLDADLFHRALDHIAMNHPDPGRAPARLLRHGPRHHTVELPGPGPGPGGRPGPYPAGLLADLLTGSPVLAGHDTGPGATGAGARHCGTLPRTLAVTPLQQTWLAGALERPGHHVEQLSWRWHGPLDADRFTAAWQAVATCETVLRTAFCWEPRPRAVVFDHCTPEVVRHEYDSASHREALRESEQARGFDLRRPGLLRVALLRRADHGPHGGTRGGTGHADSTDVLLTYHRALLDSWSVRLLLGEFCRAYLAHGCLAGGERRPDLRDYTRWLDGQDLAPAREFWQACPLPAPAPPPPPAGPGTGRCRVRLARAETTRLDHWAARWGATASSALQTVWAMLRHRAAAAEGPAPVAFGVTFPGRGLLLEGIERTPGPFENPLPVTVTVDPDQPVPRLLRTLRDHTLDLAAYEWVAPGELAGRAARAADTLIGWECGPGPDDTLRRALAAEGVRIEQQDHVGALTAYPFGIHTCRDNGQGLTLTAVFDGERVDRAAARWMLADCVRLLRALPRWANADTTVGQVLARLPAAPPPQPPPPAAAPEPLVRLRAQRAAGAGAVCLVQAPGAPVPDQQALARHHTGPQALAVLPAGAGTAPAARALRALTARGGRLALGGFCGAGALAYDLARDVAAQGGLPPLVVVGSGGTAAALVRTAAEAVGAS